MDFVAVWVSFIYVLLDSDVEENFPKYSVDFFSAMGNGQLNNKTNQI